MLSCLLTCFCSCPLLNGILVIVLTLVLWMLYINWRYRHLPPGPWKYPIVGTVLSVKGLRLYFHAAEYDLKTNGPGMVTHYASGRPLVFVNDVKKSKQIFVENAQHTSERFHFPVSLVVNPASHGIIQSDHWVAIRRMSLQILRELGFGKSIVERSIQDQCEYLQRYLSDHTRQPLDVSDILGGCTSDIISMLLFNKKPFMDNCQEEMQYVTCIQEFMRSNFRLLSFVPILYYAYVVPWLQPYLPNGRRLEMDRKVAGYLRRQIEEHRANFNTEDPPRDFVEQFLVLQHKNATSDKFEPAVWSDENLVFVLRDLFIAGTDTTSVTLCWALALLCHREDVQEQVFQELQQVIGDAVHPDVNQHLAECPYTRAVMSEVLRYGITAPTSLPHLITKDIQVDNYLIPQGAILMLNIYSMCRDPRVWKHPEEFYPEHFFDSATRTFVPHENLMSFSLGRRVCLGENLAKQEFFVFLASMVLKFRFSFSKKQEFSVEDILSGHNVGVVRSPKRFFLEVTPRG